jgi:hypothetical protein
MVYNCLTIAFPTPHVSFSPRWRQKKFDKHNPYFFSANLSKIYTKKTSINVYRSFSRWKRIFGGGKSSRLIVYIDNIGPITHLNLVGVWEVDLSNEDTILALTKLDKSINGSVQIYLNRKIVMWYVSNYVHTI